MLLFRKSFYSKWSKGLVRLLKLSFPLLIYLELILFLLLFSFTIQYNTIQSKTIQYNTSNIISKKFALLKFYSLFSEYSQYFSSWYQLYICDFQAFFNMTINTVLFDTYLQCYFQRFLDISQNISYFLNRKFFKSV